MFNSERNIPEKQGSRMMPFPMIGHLQGSRRDHQENPPSPASRNRLDAKLYEWLSSESYQ